MGDSEVSHKVNEEGSGVEVSGKIMLAAIIVLFVVILFILFLHLYARWWLWGRRTQAGTHRQSRTGRRRFVFAATQDPIFSYHRGLHPSVIRSLPVLIFNTDHFKDALECAVCLSELSDGEKARLLPKCNHGFHVDCIDMWFQSHSTCPLCRNTVALESESSTTPELSEIESPPQGNSESLNFPTNVLFWGNETQVSTRGSTGLEEEGPSSSSSLPNSSRLDESLVIEIPRLQLPDFSSSLSPSSRPAEEEFKSPATSRLRSLRRLLSREKRVIPGFPCSPREVDVEEGEGGRGQSSKTASDL